MEINEFRTEKDKIQMNYNSLHKQKKYQNLEAILSQIK